MTDKCRVCGSPDLMEVIDLGHHPPSDAFLTEEQLGRPETYYPLKLMACIVCDLGQLSYNVPHETLFNEDYPYMTGANPNGIEHFKNLADWVYQVKEYGEGSEIMDIGSNDGTLLKFFKKRKATVIGVEPCKHLAAKAFEDGIFSIPCFFSRKTMQPFVPPESIDIITATNVFAHVDDVHDFLKTVHLLLKDDGIFVIEMPDFRKMIEFNQFDQIYHEHLSYFSPKPMMILAELRDMKVKSWENIDIHGGSVRYVLVKK